MILGAGESSTQADVIVKFDAQGLIPVVAQEETTGDVLLLAYMNAEALRLTLDEGRLVLWSRSRGKLWRKGEQSGNSLRLSELRLNCEGNSLLARVRLEGIAACHEGYRTCYFRRLNIASGGSSSACDFVAAIVEPRVFDPADVYANHDDASAFNDDAVLERDVRLLYSAYERLRDAPENQASATSRLLHAADVAAMAEQSLARASEELDELRGVLGGTHRHLGGAADVILEAGQVEYWVLLAAVGLGYTCDEWQPHLAWRSGWQSPNRDANGTAHLTHNAILGRCMSLLAAAGALCSDAGVQPEQVVSADLAAMRAKYPNLV